MVLENDLEVLTVQEVMNLYIHRRFLVLPWMNILLKNVGSIRLDIDAPDRIMQKIFSS